jgi:hypothetical protein
MTCDDVCLELVSYLRRELDDSTRTWIELHLDSCRSCREEVNALRQTISTVERYLPRPTPLDALDQIPLGKLDFTSLPDDVRRPPFESCRLQVRFDNLTDQAVCRVSIDDSTLPHLALDLGGQADAEDQSNGIPGKPSCTDPLRAPRTCHRAEPALAQESWRLADARAPAGVRGLLQASRRNPR